MAFLKWFHHKDKEDALADQKQEIQIKILIEDVQRLKARNEELNQTISQWYTDQFGHK